MWLLVAVLVTLSVTVALASWLSVQFSGKPLDMAFLGALIGAGGTIFAATIAYVAVQKQIDQADKSAKDQAQQTADMKARQDRTEEAGLRALVEYCEALQDAFNKSLQSENKGNSFALESIRRAGKIVTFMGQPPSDFYGDVNTIFQRLNNLSHVVMSNLQADPGVPTTIRERETNDIAIAEVRDSIEALKQRAQREISARSRK